MSLLGELLARDCFPAKPGGHTGAWVAKESANRPEDSSTSFSGTHKSFLRGMIAELFHAIACHQRIEADAQLRAQSMELRTGNFELR